MSLTTLSTIGRPLRALAPALLLSLSLAATAHAGTVEIPASEAADISKVPVSEITDGVAAERGADVFVQAAPGQTVTAKVTPAGCEEKGCEFKLISSTPADAAQPKGPEAAEESLVAVPGNADVEVLSAAPTPGSELLATRAITVYSWNNVTDQVCSGYGCYAWQMTLGTRAFLDYTYAWGDRSRYGYAGSRTCTKGGTGYAVSQQACGYRNDPSRTELYAEFQANVAGGFKGFFINKDWYIHRHYAGDGRSWVVINY